MTRHRTIPPELVTGANRVMYACRRWTPASRGMQMHCADCGARVAVTPTVLADRRRQVHAAKRSLAIVCDDCANAEAARIGVQIAAMPSPDEIVEANS